MAEQKDIELAREQSIQSRAKEDEPLRHNVLLVLSRAGQLISPWWSRQRDLELRRFWKTVDHLAGAIYTFESRLSTIPFRIEPKDGTIRAHQRLADEFTDLLLEEADLGEGWNSFYEPWVEDLITQDNGAFAEVIGPGEIDGPLVGMPSGIAHLDSWRCVRTGNPEYPVLFQDPDGTLHKMHYTRVIYSSQMPSPDALMHRVGFSAVSRCLNIAQNLLDQMIYKQEKLGSRPARGIMVTKGGLDPDDIREALALANEAMDNQALSRFSRTAVVGHADMPEAGLDLVELSSMPDGFDERESITLGIAAIALALGVDARELFPATVTGATRADALISHLKQRGKGIGQVLQLTERKFNSKFLPDTLRMVFDFQDDAQDQQRAEIKYRRAERHSTYIKNMILDDRTIREQMVEDGDLTKDQFIRLELQSGRLEDGDSVLVLFFRPDSARDLDMGVEDPLAVHANNAADVLATIEERRVAFLAETSTANPNRKAVLQEYLAALDELELMYGGQSRQAVRDSRRPDRSPPEEERGEETMEEGGETEGIPPDSEPEDLELETEMKSDGRVLRGILAQAATAVRDAANRINGKERG